MPGMTLKAPIKKDTDLHRRLIKQIETRVRMAERKHQQQHDKWRRAEEMIVAYVPETTIDRARQARRDQGSPQYTTIQIPYAYALLMTAHTYWTSVMLARSPVHQYSGRHGEPEHSVQALEALIAYQVQQGLMLAPYYLWLYDAGKYGVGILGTYWQETLHSFSQIILDEKGEQKYITSQLRGYHGNKCYNVSPWDFLPDPRVPVNRFQEGEFCAVRRRPSWNDLVIRGQQGYYTNLDQIKGSSAQRWQLGDHQEGHLERPSVEEVDRIEDMDDRKKKHPAWLAIYEVYINLIPSEWGLGAMEWPEKWVFTVTGDCGLIIGAQPLGMVHDRYPFDILEPEPEAYGLWNRGIPETIQPLQQVMDWLVNMHFYNQRAMGAGRFVYDPSRIDPTPLKNGEPGYALALRPSAYGTDVRNALFQIQTWDPTQGNFGDFQMMLQIGERMMGINEQMFGAVAGGGRKTATEVRTATGFGVNRQKTISEFFSNVGFSTHSQMLVQNTQQLLDEAIRVKVVGDIAKLSSSNWLEVEPQEIAGFYDFVPVDGTLPVDRFAQATLWKDILAQMSRVPEVMQQYDFGKIFAWVGTLSGLKNMQQFQRSVPPAPEVVDPEQAALEAQKGNIVPIRGGPTSQAPNLPIPMG